MLHILQPAKSDLENSSDAQVKTWHLMTDQPSVISAHTNALLLLHVAGAQGETGEKSSSRCAGKALNRLLCVHIQCRRRGQLWPQERKYWNVTVKWHWIGRGHLLFCRAKEGMLYGIDTLCIALLESRHIMQWTRLTMRVQLRILLVSSLSAILIHT